MSDALTKFFYDGGMKQKEARENLHRIYNKRIPAMEMAKIAGVNHSTVRIYRKVIASLKGIIPEIQSTTRQSETQVIPVQVAEVNPLQAQFDALQKQLVDLAAQITLSTQTAPVKFVAPERVIDTSRILCFTDMHAPYHHPDTFKFLSAVKTKYEPTYVVSCGDEGDYHAMSMHDSDPDLDSAGPELKRLQMAMEDLAELFPDLDICESNHGSMAYRRARKHGIPSQCMKSYLDMLFVGSKPNWRWKDSFRVILPNGHPCEFAHCASGNLLNVAAHKRSCLVTGHLHSRFEITYGASTAALYWQMVAGSLVHDSALAFAYNKTFPKKSIIGCTVIIDSIPVLIPMLLDENGKWVGKL